MVETSMEFQRPRSSTEAERFQTFKTQMRDLQLRIRDIWSRPWKRIHVLDVGGSDQSFAYVANKLRLKKLRLNPDVVTADAALDDYDRLHTHSINHDTSEIGVPDDFFDLVLSHNAFPLAFRVWLWDEAQKTFHADVEQRLGSRVSAKFYFQGTRKDVPGAVYKGLAEMIRVTKPGGQIKMYPIQEIASYEDEPSMFEFTKIFNEALARVLADHPEITATRFNPRDDTFTRYGREITYHTYGLQLRKAHRASM